MNTMVKDMKTETKAEVQAMIDTALKAGVSVVVVPAAKAPRKARTSKAVPTDLQARADAALSTEIGAPSTPAAPAVTAKESFVGPMPLVIKKRASRPVTDTGERYTFNEAKIETVRHDLTLQGAHLHLGKDWRKAGYTAPSIRANALTALVEAFGDAEEPVFTKSEAVAVLATLPDLGCSTPASRFTKFLKSGHIVAA